MADGDQLSVVPRFILTAGGGAENGRAYWGYRIDTPDFPPTGCQSL